MICQSKSIQSFLSLGLLLLLPATASAFNRTQGNGNNLKWDSNEVTLKAGEDSFPPGDAFRTALSSLMGRFNDNPSHFEYDLEFDDSNVSLSNGENEIWFTTSLGAPARANWRYFTASGTMAEADVRVDTNRTWTAGIDKPSTTPYDGAGRPFRNVVIHEIGHGLGLAHETDTYNSMGQDWDHIHANGSIARGYFGEDASNGAVAAYGEDSDKGEDLSVSHWRHTGDDGSYSTHGRTRIFDTGDNELSNVSSGDEPRYRVNRGDTVRVEFTYENTGTATHTIDAGFYISSNDLITTWDRHLRTVRIVLGRNDVWTKRYSIDIPSDLLPNTDYHIGVIVDEQDSVTENLEANNATYIGIRTDRGDFPGTFTQWLGTFEGRNDGRRARLTIARDTSSFSPHEGAGFEVTLEDLDRSVTFQTTVPYRLSGPKHELQIGTLTASDGSTKRLPRLLLHTWDSDFISGATRWSGNPFGAGFVREGPKADLLTARSGSPFDTSRPQREWVGTFEGRNDGRNAELQIQSTDFVTRKGDQQFFNFNVRLKDLDRNMEFTGTGLVNSAGPFHLMQFFSPLTAGDGTTKDVQRLLIHTWDKTFVSGHTDWQGTSFGLLFARKQFDFTQITHEVIGDLQVGIVGGEVLSLINFGDSGEDGVNLRFDQPAIEAGLNLDGLDFATEGTRVEFVLTGDVESETVGRIRGTWSTGIERIQKNLRVFADFSFIDDADHKFEVYRQGELVAVFDTSDELLLNASVEGLPSLVAVRAVQGIRGSLSPGPVFMLTLDRLAEMQGVSQGSSVAAADPVVGDEIRVLPQDDSVRVESLAGFALFAANLDELQILGEQVTPAAPSELPDLVVQDFNLDQADALQPAALVGDTLSIQVANQGATATGTPFSVGVYLSNDPTIDRQDTLLVGGREFISELPAGATTEIRLPEDTRLPEELPRGTVYLGVIVDEGSDIEEASEANNTVARPIEVRIPQTRIEFSFSLAEGELTLSWDDNFGVLQTADQIGGPWRNVADQTSPSHASTSNSAAGFFRVVPAN